ncbi:MAG: hypothetical protein V1906_03665 [Candidatus Woesearchaeota archaeon]
MKVCTSSELKELEDIMFEDNLSLSTYTRFMDKVKANYLSHTHFEENIETLTPPSYWLGSKLDNPSARDYLGDINSHFRMPLLGMGGLYSGSVEEGKPVILNYRNFDILMQNAIGLRGIDLDKSRKKLRSWFGNRKRYYKRSEIEKIEYTHEWKKLFDEIREQKEIGWRHWEHDEGQYFFYRNLGRIHLARRIYKVSAVGDELSVDLS